MGRYTHLVGRRVGLSYRGGTTNLLASGTLVADSGHSISIENRHADTNKTLRWKVPYPHIIRVVESDSAPASDQERVPKATQSPSFRRRSLRVSASKPLVLSWQEGGCEHVESAFTFYISRFGCSLQSHRFFEPGTRVRLDYAARTIEGRVVYSLKDHSTNLVEVGVGFDEDGSEFWQVVF